MAAGLPTRHLLMQGKLDAVTHAELRDIAGTCPAVTCFVAIVAAVIFASEKQSQEQFTETQDDDIATLMKRYKKSQKMQ